MVGKKERILRFLQQNCICIAAFITVVMLYLGLVPVLNRFPYRSLIPWEQVTGLEGILVSNPVKTGSGKFYRCTVQLQQVQGLVGQDRLVGQDSGINQTATSLVTAEATGRVTVYLPAPFVEAHYPGKLYSAVGKSFTSGLIEQGAKLQVKCRPNSKSPQSSTNHVLGRGEEPIFYGESCHFIGFPSTIVGKIQEFRGLCRLQFKRLMYGWGDAGGLLVALLCGSGEYTNREVGDAFRGAGLAHVLALSGMHLSFFAGLAAAAFRGGGRRLSLALSLLAILLFVWFAGLSPSLFRATICSILGMAAGVLGIRPPMIKILALCFFIHLVTAPQDLFQLSFQLSYLALAGILLIGPLFEPSTHRFLPPAIASSMSASIGAQIFSTPVTLFSLGTMMPGGIIASVVVSPLVSLFMTVGVVAIILSLLYSPLGEPLGHLVNLLYTCVIVPVKFFAKIPALEIS